MKGQLAVNIGADLAKALLSASASTAGVENPYRRMMVRYRSQLYDQMMSCPDDMLAGYRGMLLCINQLLGATTTEQLHRTISKPPRDKPNDNC